MPITSANVRDREIPGRLSPRPQALIVQDSFRHVPLSGSFRSGACAEIDRVRRLSLHGNSVMDRAPRYELIEGDRSWTSVGHSI